MRIKGKFGFKALKDMFMGFAVAAIVALIVLGFFSLISLISWGMAWILLAVLLTPVGFWFVRFNRDEIDIAPIEENEIDSIIRIEDE